MIKESFTVPSSPNIGYSAQDTVRGNSYLGELQRVASEPVPERSFEDLTALVERSFPGEGPYTHVEFGAYTAGEGCHLVVYGDNGFENELMAQTFNKDGRCIEIRRMGTDVQMVGTYFKYDELGRITQISIRTLNKNNNDIARLIIFDRDTDGSISATTVIDTHDDPNDNSNAPRWLRDDDNSPLSPE